MRENKMQKPKKKKMPLTLAKAVVILARSIYWTKAGRPFAEIHLKWTTETS